MVDLPPRSCLQQRLCGAGRHCSPQARRFEFLITVSQILESKIYLDVGPAPGEIVRRVA